jgi:hypothetical protein
VRRQVFSFLLILLLSSWVGQPASGAATADEPTPTGSTEMPFTLGPDFVTFTTWTNGSFVFVQDRHSAAPLLRFVDRNGTQVSEFRFSIPGASRINIYDNLVALGMDQSLAIAGTYSDDSRGGMFVAWVSPDRKEQTVIRTSPFFPAAVTIASDGTIWVAGAETKQQDGKWDYSRPLIRRYDKTGKLLGSFLPWSSLETDALPFPGSVLLPLKDHVLWYSPRPRTYFDFSADGSVINRFKSAPHPEHDLTHVAVCDDGSIFASTGMWDNSGTQTHWGIFKLYRPRGEWTFIPRNERWGLLFGCDGTRLASTTDFKTISWLETKAK